MLELKKITKEYKTNDYSQKALDRVSVCFRKNEFAAILGPSGSGKTTLLNIIGGLDHYDKGDLVINEVSTKNYKDRDWDSYRNHRIGFVFQSYNLIPHQSVLANVELALTLSGVSDKERKRRAKEALIKVGLEKHINKRPSQLSGGQMQRVAIARALVNNPDILLADEPTGALDSETSTQIMEIIKEVAKDKLVIMVTHNPELANLYSTRIIELKDGQIIDDSNPYDGKVNTKNNLEEESYKTKKTSMGFLTALSLSLNNLMTKKGRTILTAFAGSIGIIGIALILSLSTGFQDYINQIQEDTLSSYPLQITEETADMTSLFLSLVDDTKGEKAKKNKIIEKQTLTKMFSSVSTNDLKSFKKHIESNYKLIENDVTQIQYGYSVMPLIYSKYKNKYNKVNPQSMFSMGMSSYATSLMQSNIFMELSNDKEYLDETYDMLEGRWPQSYDELVIILSKPNEISELLVYSLGFRDMEELSDAITKMMSGETVIIKNEPISFTYEDLMKAKLKLIMPPSLYKYNTKYDVYEDMTEDKDYFTSVYNKSLDLKIVGIASAKDSLTTPPLTSISYTSGLIDYIIKESSKTEIVKKQIKNKNIDVFSNKDFDEKNNSSALGLDDLIHIDKDALSSAFNINIDEKSLKSSIESISKDISSSITADIEPAKESYGNTLASITRNLLNDYINNNGPVAIIDTNSVDSLVSNYMSKTNTKNMLKDLENKYVIPSSVYESTYIPIITSALKGYIATYYQGDQSFTTDPSNPAAPLMSQMVEPTVNGLKEQVLANAATNAMAEKMTEAKMQKEILTNVGKLSNTLMSSLSTAFNIDQEKIAKAFQIDIDEDELKRVITSMMSNNGESNAKGNLIKLGYQDKDEPTYINVYFKSFDSKENFLDFIEKYNNKMEDSNQEDKKINYTDATGILMSSVKKVVNAVSYVLIAFVSISLVVSSIMIAIITYISVLERTKEIGVLRAIGASKKDVTRVFNAETFIEGLVAGLMGIGVTILLNIPINIVIYKLTNIKGISTLPVFGAISLVIISVVLTVIAGLIPSKMASKKDPVIALRSE